MPILFVTLTVDVEEQPVMVSVRTAEYVPAELTFMIEDVTAPNIPGPDHKMLYVGELPAIKSCAFGLPQSIFPDALIVGLNALVIPMVVEDTQPLSKPLTVKIIVVNGFTFTVCPFKPPGYQVYDVAPFADNVTVPPAQVVVGFEFALTVGDGITVNVFTTEAVQPRADVPVKVKEGLMKEGVAVSTVLVLPPGFQV